MDLEDFLVFCFLRCLVSEVLTCCHCFDSLAFALQIHSIC
uniref:Uncharacterized protein n=1 Tax=Rhizophora mucronata TaxID=61149 RepID=A0A2P2QVG5_RHIMU